MHFLKLLPINCEDNAQLDDAVLKILTRNVLTPAPQVPLAHLVGSYPLKECMDQHLLLALGTGGYVRSY